MLLFLLTLASATILAIGAALGYMVGRDDGYDAGWRARSYTTDPCRPSLRVLHFTDPTEAEGA